MNIYLSLPIFLGGPVRPISSSRKPSVASISKPKPVERRRFQLSRTKLDYPVLGGRKNDVDDSAITLLPRSNPTSEAFLTNSTAISLISSSGSLYSERSRKVNDALSSSKLVDMTGPLEASPRLSKRQKKRLRDQERSLTKGSAWFNMAKAEITKEKKDDLNALKLRSAMGGILHYKRNNITHTPKYFQTGTIVETSADFYSSRIPKRQRQKTLAQEFAADYGMS